MAAPRHVTVATWLAVTGVGLAIGAFGVGGLTDLLVGPDDDVPPVAPAAQVPVDAGPAGPRRPREGRYVAFEPTSIRLPSGRLAPVQRARVHHDGSLDVPRDPDRVGWWTGGAQAGDPYGSIVLAGHVDSAAFGVGVLAEMIDMRPGQDLKVADGRHGQVYRVQTIRRVAKARLTSRTGLFDQDVGHRLVMITCGGPFDPRTHRYRDNVVIVANPVG
jgi:hypothetical protein